MLLFGRHVWRGESGRRYRFHCALTKSGIPHQSGGVYIFVKRRLGFILKPLYIGKAADLRSRLLGHEKWGAAWWIHGATERYTMKVASESERRLIEEDLIRALHPKMNDLQMPRSKDDAPNTPALARKWRWRRMVRGKLATLWGGPRADPLNPRHGRKGAWRGARSYYRRQA